MLQIAVCDDREEDRDRITGLLCRYLKESAYEYEITEYKNGEMLADDYEEGFVNFDLIFMDIYMEQMLGMEAARQVRRYSKNTAIIFLTETPDYALESYDVGAFGYLVKPLDEEKAVRLLERFIKERYLEKKTMFLKEGRKSVRISFGEVEYVESRRNYVVVHLENKEEHKVYTKLDNISQMLDEYGFLRCHQSFLVNMNKVRKADKEFILDSGAVIPIRQRDTKAIRNMYFEYILNKAEFTRI